MNNRPQHNPTLQQWIQMQQQANQQANQQGYVKKKGCNCGGKKKKIQ